MCKDNTISISWSWLGAIIGLIIIGIGIIVTTFGVCLTWGEIVIIPFILTFFLNKKQRYTFTDSGFMVQWMRFRRNVSFREIQRIDVFTTKSGTWIVIELYESPSIEQNANRREIVSSCMLNPRKSFLIPLQWGERDKALEILRGCCPRKIVIVPKADS